MKNIRLNENDNFELSDWRISFLIFSNKYVWLLSILKLNRFLRTQDCNYEVSHS